MKWICFTTASSMYVCIVYQRELKSGARTQKYVVYPRHGATTLNRCNVISLPSWMIEIAGCLGFCTVTSSPTGGWICSPRLILRVLGFGTGLLAAGATTGWVGTSGEMYSSELEEFWEQSKSHDEIGLSSIRWFGTYSVYRSGLWVSFLCMSHNH